MLTSRQIIIKLIDNKIITGEEAFTLINDIIQAEMVETYKVLEKKDNEKLSQPWNSEWNKLTTSPIWVGGTNTITCDSGTCANTAVLGVSGLGLVDSN